MSYRIKPDAIKALDKDEIIKAQEACIYVQYLEDHKAGHLEAFEGDCFDDFDIMAKTLKAYDFVIEDLVDYYDLESISE